MIVLNKVRKLVGVAVCAATVTLLSQAPALAQTLRPWMSPEVQAAWNQGFRGQGASITVIDSYSGGQLSGRLDGRVEAQTHGQWTSRQARMVAPLAMVYAKDFSSSREPVVLRTGLNVMNLSYGMMAARTARNISWAPQEASIIAYARAGRAIAAKAAGNDAVAVGAVNARGQIDFLNTSLIGAQSAVFVGALASNGTPNAKARLASYSNFAGANPVVQQQFLVVGVNSGQMGLAGTSFAAPIVAGYAAIVGSKFRTATPTQITRQLLNTARTDTIANYNVAVHGRGEASIARALAPVALR
jgi:subtilisin family serine protease